MARTYITDLKYFLDDEGGLAPDSGPVGELIEYLTSIVAMVSYPTPEPPSEYKIQCIRNEDGNQCPGNIVGKLVPESEDIVWHCPVCNDKGVISNWQGTLWDLSQAHIEH